MRDYDDGEEHTITFETVMVKKSYDFFSLFSFFKMLVLYVL